MDASDGSSGQDGMKFGLERKIGLQFPRYFLVTIEKGLGNPLCRLRRQP
jgi:hypothetical protein